MKINTLPPIETLKEWFIVDPDEGILRWRKNGAGTGVKSGSPAGHKYERGHFGVRFQGKAYKSHRIIYKLYHGELEPNYIVDHIDGDPSNNSINNLRKCTNQENLRNRTTLDKQNTSGYRNVRSTRRGKCNYWLVHITYDRINGKEQRYIKYFNKDKFSLEEVVSHAERKRKEFFGEFS